jgi:hypothetical protein
MIVLHRYNNGRRIVMAKATQPSSATVIQDRARDCPGADPLYRRGTITKGAWEASTTVGVTRSQPKHRVIPTVRRSSCRAMQPASCLTVSMTVRRIVMADDHASSHTPSATVIQTVRRIVMAHALPIPFEQGSANQAEFTRVVSQICTHPCDGGSLQ